MMEVEWGQAVIENLKFWAYYVSAYFDIACIGKYLKRCLGINRFKKSALSNQSRRNTMYKNSWESIKLLKLTD